MPYGIILYDASGNVTMDTTTFTVRDSGIYTAASITSVGNYALPIPVTSTAVVSVINNSVSDSTNAMPDVVLDVPNNRVVIANANGSFNLSLRIVDYR